MRRLLLLLTLAALLGVGAAQTSLAAFTASSENAGNVLTAAPDWTPPVVALRDPGSPLRGVVDLSASATDDVTGVASVRLSRSPAGAGSWAEICTVAASPYVCELDTATIPDGRYDLRAAAVDRAGNEAEVVVADRLVDNTAPEVVMGDPGSPLSGTVTLSATATDATSGIAKVTIEHRAPGAVTWQPICSVPAPGPFTCGWDTTSVVDGDHALRALAQDRAGNGSVSAVVADRAVRNAPATAGPITLVGTSSSATMTGPLSLARPTSVQQGDVLIAQVTIENGTALLAPPTGWTPIASVDQSSNLGMRTYWRVAGASEPAAYSWGTAGKKASGGIAAYRGVHPSAPVEVAGTGSGNGTTMAAPSVSTATPNGRLVALFGSKSLGAAHDQPAGMTRRWVTGASDFRSSANDQALTTTGATGARSAGSSGGDAWVAQTIALRAR
jgi:hypothetical protein